MDSSISAGSAFFRPFEPGIPASITRIALAVGLGLLAFELAPPDFRAITRFIMGWDGFVMSTLLLSWITIFHTSVADIRHNARVLRPEHTWVVLLLAVLVGVTISLMAVVFTLHGLHNLPGEEQVEQVLVSVVAVSGTWCLMHTLFALHYAHSYFIQPGPDAERQGLRFAGNAPASYWDFVYFAFVVGMSAQTSDVSVTSTPMRRLVMFHGILAFAFNTAILTLSINILAGLL
jgi:uncharacterized membrane protein